jgi:hypothetical protein
LLKRFSIFTVVVAILMVPSLLFAADRLAPVEAKVNADNTVTVPLSIANQDGLMAIDIPLRFSEGVTLKDVNFDDVRVSYFDLKISKIDNDENTVIIGLVTQTTPEAKENLPAGEGVVAHLVFEVDDPAVSEIALEPFETQRPHHSLTFVYCERTEESATFERTSPTFDATTVALSGAAPGNNLPTAYNLAQNYPNPFNPTTEIALDLPVAGHVNLTVFNVLGQQVRTLVDADMPAGSHVVSWDGTSGSGNAVSSGVYFYRLETGSFVETKKMMLLK